VIALLRCRDRDASDVAGSLGGTIIQAREWSAATAARVRVCVASLKTTMAGAHSAVEIAVEH
jgi:hypothetical protein